MGLAPRLIARKSVTILHSAMGASSFLNTIRLPVRTMLWLNLGYWEVARTYPEAAASLSASLQSRDVLF
jgi:hypothetical protein